MRTDSNGFVKRRSNHGNFIIEPQQTPFVPVVTPPPTYSRRRSKKPATTITLVPDTIIAQAVKGSCPKCGRVVGKGRAAHIKYCKAGK